MSGLLLVPPEEGAELHIQVLADSEVGKDAAPSTYQNQTLSDQALGRFAGRLASVEEH